MDKVMASVFLFILAGLCEIGGGWLVWQWLREGRGVSWGLLGALVLIAMGSFPLFSLPILGEFMRPMEDFSLSCL